MDSLHHIFSKLAEARVDTVFNKKITQLTEIVLIIKSVLRKEEEAFTKHNLPMLDFETHTASHHEFERVLNTFMDDVREARTLRKIKLDDLINYIRAWTTYHEENFDKFTQSWVRISEYNDSHLC